jgi:hypothetical protein
MEFSWNFKGLGSVLEGLKILVPVNGRFFRL